MFLDHLDYTAFNENITAVKPLLKAGMTNIVPGLFIWKDKQNLSTSATPVLSSDF